MAGETSRDRYLSEAEHTRTGVRVFAAIFLFGATASVAFIGVVPVILSVLPGRPVPLLLGNLAWLSATLSSFAAIGVGVGFVYQSAWVWRAFGAWATALAITIVTAVLSMTPTGATFVGAFALATIALTGMVAWVIQRYGRSAR
jgi:hypothetical protein